MYLGDRSDKVSAKCHLLWELFLHFSMVAASFRNFWYFAFISLLPVYLSSGCYNRMSQSMALKQQKFVFHSPGQGRPRSRCQLIQFLVRDLPLSLLILLQNHCSRCTGLIIPWILQTSFATGPLPVLFLCGCSWAFLFSHFFFKFPFKCHLFSPSSIQNRSHSLHSPIIL